MRDLGKKVDQQSVPSTKNSADAGLFSFSLRSRRTFWACLTLLLCALPFVAAAQETEATVSFLPLIGDPGPPAALPAWSGPIAVAPDGSVWVVNPDAGSLTHLAGEPFAKLAEIPVGGEPWSLAIAPDNATVYTLDRAGGSLLAVNAIDHTVERRATVGPEPGGLVLSADGRHLYVSLMTADAVVVVDVATLDVLAHVPVDPAPFALARAGERLYVTHLSGFPISGTVEAEDDSRQGRITVINTATGVVHGQIGLEPNERGMASILASVAVSGGRAWVPHVRSAPALPNRLTTTVFAAVAVLDLTSGQEEPAAQLALNDEIVFGSPVNNPVAAVPSPDGKTLYVVLAGSNLVEVVDISHPTAPALVKFLPTGTNPRGVALSADGRRGYVMNYLSRSVTVLDLERLEQVAEVPVTEETLDPPILRGKILFNSAVDPRLTKGSWVSCASCHPDGGTDNITWIFPDGPRQTPALWNAGQTLPWHWSAALDEPQDVEETIHIIQHGLGLAPNTDPPQLGTPNAGRSTDLDALASFLVQGIRPPTLLGPAEQSDAGRRLFVTRGCVACHGGPQWTASSLPGVPGMLDPDGNGMVDNALRDVGTLNSLDIRGISGFDPPSLVGVGLTAPYLHDGSIATLEALLASGHPDSDGSRLSEAEVQEMVAFLRTIGAQTEPLTTRSGSRIYQKE